MPDSQVMRRCRICGCTEVHACTGSDGQPCYWFELDLCSACVHEVYSPEQLARFVDAVNAYDPEDLIPDHRHSIVELFSEAQMNAFLRAIGSLN